MSELLVDVALFSVVMVIAGLIGFVSDYLNRKGER